MKTHLELESIRKRQPKERGIGLTYNIAKCKSGYGVYLKAVSGLSLIALRHKLPGIEVNLQDETSPDYGRITFNGNDIHGGLRVNSNRLARYKTELDCQQFIDKLVKLDALGQWKRINKIRVWLIDKDKVLLKLQYYQFHTTILGREYKMLTSQDKVAVERLAMDYAEQGERSRIRPTVARTKAFHPSQVQDIAERAEIKAYNVPGLKGMCKPLKDTGITNYDKRGVAGGGEFCRRITQRRKRTTTLSFFNKYR